jgi:tRNA threonylcarbamoyladenosine biosynthesis protein TsaB
MEAFRCVAVETATGRGSVAACHADRVVVRELDEGQTSSRQIYRLVSDALDELGCTIAQLNCVAYGCGPGSFTGVRVAASVAQALAYSQSLPVCRISTLAALAAPAIQRDQPVAACLDARMGEAYVAVYKYGEGGGVIQELADRLVNPAEFKLADGFPGAIAIGPGWDVWATMLDGHEGEVRADVWPDASAVLGLAKNMYARGETVGAADAIPNYVRNTVTQQ